MKLLSLLFPLLLLNSCVRDLDKDKENPRETLYTIEAGHHFSNESRVVNVKGKSLRFKVRFDQSAIYSLGRNPDGSQVENQWDINKLYGFSEGWDNQRQSARFGWAYVDSALRLYGYVHDTHKLAFQTEVHSVELGKIEIDKTYDCEVAIGEPAENIYKFTLQGITKTLPRSIQAPEIQGFLQYPYFGGDELAPHQIRIWITQL